MNQESGIQREQLKDKVRISILKDYSTHGIKHAIDFGFNVVSECEKGKYATEVKIATKGEATEAVLEVILRFFQQTFCKNAIISKGLCIPALTGNNVPTEMDLCFFTETVAAMFECKSYAGKKTLTKECTLSSGHVTTDVWKQSLTHMSILNQYLSKFRVDSLEHKPRIRPYKLCLFHMSTLPVSDLRNREWRQRIPLLTKDTILPNLIRILAIDAKHPGSMLAQRNWDIERMQPTLQRLSDNSEKMFKLHMLRIQTKEKEKRSHGGNV